MYNLWVFIFWLTFIAVVEAAGDFFRLGCCAHTHWYILYDVMCEYVQYVSIYILIDMHCCCQSRVRFVLLGCCVHTSDTICVCRKMRVCVIYDHLHCDWHLILFWMPQEIFFFLGAVSMYNIWVFISMSLEACCRRRCSEQRRWQQPIQADPYKYTHITHAPILYQHINLHI